MRPSSAPLLLREMLKMYGSSALQASAGNMRQYGDAINLLNSRRRNVRPQMLPQLAEGPESLPAKPTFTGKPSLLGMKAWLNSLGHSDNDVDNLNVIHVAGTKGKGSTCAFTSSFLHAHGDRTGYPKKIGLYTSPHLKRVQERIQINRKPVSEELFTKYVFEVWDNLASRTLPKPRYLQLLLLVAVHTFISETVDVAIFETHHGGEYDATNFFLAPVVTGISTIGMDHVEQLGPTIDNIAWHKAGIFKSGRPAFSAPQEPPVAAMLERRARERDVVLQYVDVDPLLPVDASCLRPQVQRMNASLALALTRAFLSDKTPTLCQDLTGHDISTGVQQFFWIGRFQQVTQGRHHWYLDGAHNELSVSNAAEWFAEMAVQNQSVSASSPHIVIFSHISDRDGATLLRSIASTLQERHTPIQHLIISTYEQQQDDVNNHAGRCSRQANKPFTPEMQQQYIDAWRSIFPHTDTAFEATVAGALDVARSLDRGCGMQTLITGSLYLVGGALRILEPLV